MILLAVDPGSLDLLHDIVVPPAASSWPLRSAWYLLFFAIVVPMGLIIRAVIMKWMKNRYRREALVELERIAHSLADSDGIPQIAILVKRVALAAYPRGRVASLSGAEWLTFLDSTSGSDGFTLGPGAVLEAGYSAGSHPASAELIDTVRRWIKFHPTDLPC